jgi:hypothetical protein
MKKISSNLPYNNTDSSGNRKHQAISAVISIILSAIACAAANCAKPVAKNAENFANRVLPNIEYHAANSSIAQEGRFVRNFNPAKIDDKTIHIDNIKANSLSPLQQVPTSYYARPEIVQHKIRFRSDDGENYTIYFNDVAKTMTHNENTVNQIMVIPDNHVPDFGSKGYHGYPEKNRPYEVYGVVAHKENGVSKNCLYVKGQNKLCDKGTYTEHWGDVKGELPAPDDVVEMVYNLLDGQVVNVGGKNLKAAPCVTEKLSQGYTKAVPNMQIVPIK